MSLVSSQQLARMRRIVAAQLTDTCTVQRSQSSRDQYGIINTDEWVNVAYAIACRVLPFNQMNNQNKLGAGEAGTAYFRIIVAYNTDVQDGDRLVIAGAIYEVLGLEDIQTDRVDKRLRCARVGNG